MTTDSGFKHDIFAFFTNIIDNELNIQYLFKKLAMPS